MEILESISLIRVSGIIMKKKFYSFENAERAAFEIFEEFHTTQAEREHQYWLSRRNSYENY